MLEKIQGAVWKCKYPRKYNKRMPGLHIWYNSIRNTRNGKKIEEDQKESGRGLWTATQTRKKKCESINMIAINKIRWKKTKTPTLQ